MSVTVVAAGLPAPATAQVISQEHQIVVTGVVPDLRMVVVDQQGRIKLVTSNTPRNVPPRVVLLSLNGPQVPLSQPAQQTYDRLMGQVREDKAVTIQPAPSPLSDLFPNFLTGPAVTGNYKVTPARPGEAPYWVY